MDHELSKLEQLEEILETSKDSENSQAQGSSKPRKRAATGKGELQKELSDLKLQKLQEQLNIRRRKSVSRGSVGIISPPTYENNLEMPRTTLQLGCIIK